MENNAIRELIKKMYQRKFNIQNKKLFLKQVDEYYDTWARLFDPASVGVNEMYFPDGYKRNIRTVPAGIRKIVMGQNFNKKIYGDSLPASLKEIVYKGHQKPVLKKFNKRTNIRVIPERSNFSAQTNSSPTVSAETQTNSSQSVSTETQTNIQLPQNRKTN